MYPVVTHETLTWTPKHGKGGDYRSGIPARIADATVNINPAVIDASEQVAQAIVRSDSEYNSFIWPYWYLEAAASSEIEGYTATLESVGAATIGQMATPDARLIAANIDALRTAHDGEDAIAIQQTLLRETAPQHTGQYRDQIVWIGGGYSTPMTATAVPPHPDRIQDAMDDLAVFSARDDIPAIAHLALEHAQFETIHPFPDGNGRAGRALAMAGLRRHRVTRTPQSPVSLGLLRNRTAYYDALTAYRLGDITPIISVFTAAFRYGSDVVEALEREQPSLARDDQEKLVGVRAHSAARDVAQHALDRPVLDSRYLVEELGLDASRAHRALALLVEKGVLTVSGDRHRNRLWTHPGMYAILRGELIDARPGMTRSARG